MPQEKRAAVEQKAAAAAGMAAAEGKLYTLLSRLQQLSQQQEAAQVC